MGWGCSKHECDAGADAWKEKMKSLCIKQLDEHPGTWGRQSFICPWCWEELESVAQQAIDMVAGPIPAEREREELLKKAEAVGITPRTSYSRTVADGQMQILIIEMDDVTLKNHKIIEQATVPRSNNQELLNKALTKEVKKRGIGRKYYALYVRVGHFHYKRAWIHENVVVVGTEGKN